MAHFDTLIWPPPAPDQAGLLFTPAPYWIDLQWPVGQDNPCGIGLAGYNVYRDNVLLGKTTYSIPLGQLTQVTHGTVSGGTFTPDNTSTVNYAYDAYGRTSQVQFGAADLNYARTFTYNQANRILTQTMGWNMYTSAINEFGQTLPPQMESYGMSYQWDNEGKMTSYNDLYGQAYNYTYDGMGGATNLSACTQYDGNGNCITGDNVFSATAAYGPANQITSLSYLEGNTGLVNESRTYNSLMQLTHLARTGTRTMNMTYNYPTNNNGRISSSVDAISPQTVNYTYDGLNRLTAAQATGGWGEAYVYDGFGNLEAINQTATGGEQWSATIDPTTNRLANVNYDANGNQIGDQVYANYVWNVENRIVQQLTAGTGGTWYGGTSYSYDPSGRRVMKNVNADPAGTNTGSGYGAGTWEFYFYGLNGRKMGTISCAYNTGYLELCQVTASSTYFAGKLVNEGGDGPVATDRLGSVRSNNLTGGANIQYFPYGAEQTATQEGLAKFGTYTRDAVGQDYAEQRYYNAGMGRFWSPDRSAGRTGVPASLNKYAYAQGDPINFGDPHGTELYYAGGGVTVNCPDGVTNIYDASCTGGDGGGSGGCTDSMGLMDTGDPGCYVPEPPADLQCSERAQFGRVNAFPSGGASGTGWFSPAYLLYNASGGIPPYQWTETQNVDAWGWLKFASGQTMVFNEAFLDAPLTFRESTNTASITYGDGPGVFQETDGGVVTSGQLNQSFVLSVTVKDSPGTTTQCPPLDWFSSVRVRNSVGSGGASLTSLLFLGAGEISR